MRYKKGFTLIEVAVAVAIIGVLATLTIVTFTSQQIKARDSARSSKATIIADSLEKYYDEHLEYPSPRALLSTYGGNTGDAVASLLSINEKSILVMPQATAGITNSIAPALGSGDVIAYVAHSTVGDDNCQNSVQGGCDEFTLTYKKESDNSTVTIESVNKGRTDNPSTPLQPPSKPTIVATQSGTNIVVTSSTPTCSSTLSTSPRYAFRSQVRAGTWSTWSTWQTTNTLTRSSNANNTSYSFQVHVRCESSTFMSDTSADSDIATITYYTPPTAPAAPSLSLSPAAGTVATSATATVSGGTCNYGTLQYAIDARTNDGTWSAGSWGTTTTRTVSANQGVKYGFRATGRCVNGTQIATGSTSAESTVVTGVAAPAAPSMSGSGPTWSWSPASCATGTSPMYQYRFTSNNTTNFAGAWSLGSWIETSSTSTTNAAATAQGVMYGIDIQQRCYSAYTTSGWGTQNGGTVYIVPVTHVAVNHWSSMIVSGGYPKVLLKTYTGACASNFTRQSRLSVKWYTTTWEGPTGWFTGTEGYTQTFTSHNLLSDTDTAEFGVQTRCVNIDTGYATDSAGKPFLESPFDIGNLINSSGKYLISCKTATGYKSYCAGGYDTGGTKNTTSTSILNCAERSTGIDTLNIRNTARFSFGTASLCWNA